MLDDLLGRTELKERIDTLEEERDRLQRRFEAEEDRRVEAVSARQAAEERINRLEDRIADLEGRLAEITAEEPTDISFRRTEAVRGSRCESVLDRLSSVETPPEGALTAMVETEVPEAVRNLLGDRTPLVSRAAPCLVVADDAGLVAAALAPPIAPDPFVTWRDRFRIDREWFSPAGRHALALVRSDLFAVGVYEGTERVAFEGFESDVKGDHSKGGFSQGRFERRRDEQIEGHLDRCHQTLADTDVETVYIVGDRQLIAEFDADATAAVDATGDPSAALDDAVRDFWTTRVYGL